jgi:hypothetical protein
MHERYRRVAAMPKKAREQLPLDITADVRAVSSDGLEGSDARLHAKYRHSALR